jgi:methyl-accepting chemotaxis protein
MSGHTSASARAAAFRAAFVKLSSAGLGLAAATTLATLSWTGATQEDWIFPGLGLLISCSAWLAASKNRVAMGAQLLCFGYAVLSGASLLLGESPILQGGAKLALVPVVLVFAILNPMSNALAFSGVLALLMVVPPLVRDPGSAAILGPALSDLFYVAVFGIVGAVLGHQLREAEESARERENDLDTALAQASRIARGDLRGELQGEDDVTRVLRSMLHELRRLVEQVQAGVRILASATTQIAAMSTEHERGAVHQASAVAETRETIESFAESARRIAQSSRGVLENAENTLKNSELAGERITALTSHTRRIDELLEFIKEVANKSELLALNAALEGTKAGEAGRGFSLVAAQMQRLAESTTETVKDVKGLIADISSATNATVLSMEQATKLAADTTRAAREISLITQQQGSSAEQVVEAMKDIATVTNEFAGGTKDTLKAIEEITRLTERLQRTAHRFAIPSPPSGGSIMEVEDDALDAAD